MKQLESADSPCKHLPLYPTDINMSLKIEANSDPFHLNKD